MTRKIHDRALFDQLLSTIRSAQWLRTPEREQNLTYLLLSKHVGTDYPLLLSLLNRFLYVDSDGVFDAISKMRSWIDETLELSSKNTYFVPKKTARLDSSSTLIGASQSVFAASSKNSWSRRNFLFDKREILNLNDRINVVLLDDFSGTGRSVKEFLGWFDSNKVENQQLTFYACFIAAMNETREYLSDQNITIHSLNWIGRGITDFYVNPSQYVDAMKRMEEALLSARNYSLGYESSETLFKAELFNIPNNNFPIFWHSSLKRKSGLDCLFGRLR